MDNLTVKEVASIKELANINQLMAIKLNCYAKDVADEEIKKAFKNAAISAEKSAHNLIQLL